MITGEIKTRIDSIWDTFWTGGIIQRFHNLDAEAARSRKDQSFLVPVAEIREKDYDLSINKYKEVEREQVVYDAPEVIMQRLAQLEREINSAIDELKKQLQ